MIFKVTASDPDLQPFSDKLAKAMDRRAELDPAFMERIRTGYQDVILDCMLYGERQCPDKP